MAWTPQQKVDYLIRQPWTIIAETTPEGDHLLRVTELPAAVGCGEDDQSLSDDFWESFVATLEAYVAMDVVPPLPKGITKVPWATPDGPDETEPRMLQGKGAEVISIEHARTTSSHVIAAHSIDRLPMVAAGGI